MEIKENPATHTHYDPYRPPYKVIGTLVDCEDRAAHDPSDSEMFADYAYAPSLVPSKNTGLPALAEQLILAHYLATKSDDVYYAITDAFRDGEAWEVIVTNRWATGDGWHTERYRFEDGRVIRVVPNPHPPYVHEPPFCANCGY